MTNIVIDKLGVVRAINRAGMPASFLAPVAAINIEAIKKHVGSQCVSVLRIRHNIAHGVSYKMEKVLVFSRNPRWHGEVRKREYGDLWCEPYILDMIRESLATLLRIIASIAKDDQSLEDIAEPLALKALNESRSMLREHTFHMERFYQNARMEAGWISEVRLLIGSIDAELVDLRGLGQKNFINPDVDTYPVSQAFALEKKSENSNGIVYQSLRHDGGQCIAIFFPDVVTPPKQGDHFRYHWNGDRIDYVQQLTGSRPVLQ